jgi:secretion/DNA translocation related TadE-like protein
MTRDCERGSVTVIAIALVMISAALLFGVARIGLATVLRTRAANAADAAALAAADQLALGYDSARARAAAEATAADNGAVLVVCACDGTSAEVVVRFAFTVPIPGFSDVEARARAEVDDSP